MARGTTRPRASPGSTRNDAAGNVLSFLRHGVDADGNPTVLACVANFSGGPHDDYRVGLPFAGRWREVLNTDAEIYGGSGVGNLGAVEAEPQMWHGRPASAALRLPPPGCCGWPRSGLRWTRSARQAAADIGQSAPVATRHRPRGSALRSPRRPVRGPSRRVRAGQASDSTEMPELSSGDGTIGGRHRPGVRGGRPAGLRGPGGFAGAEQPAWRRAARPTGAGAPRNTDEPQFPDEAPADAVGSTTRSCSTRPGHAPSAGVGADAPVVAPEVPQVEVAPLGTGPEEVPADVARRTSPRRWRRPRTRGRGARRAPVASDVAERPVAVGGSPGRSRRRRRRRPEPARRRPRLPLPEQHPPVGEQDRAVQRPPGERPPHPGRPQRVPRHRDDGHGEQHRGPSGAVRRTARLSSTSSPGHSSIR